MAECILIQIYEANKTEYMSFREKRTIFTLRSRPLKLTGNFICFGSNISSTENDVNIRRVKA